MEEKKNESVFTLTPDFVTTNPKTGKDEETRGKRYVMLHSLGVGTGPSSKIYFTPDDCKYWMAERREASTDFFNKYLPHLRWKFSDTEIVRGKDGIEREVDNFPPTTKNCLAKKEELVQDALKNDPQEFDIRKIEAIICPWLDDHPRTKALGDRVHGSDYVESQLKKLERSIRGL